MPTLAADKLYRPMLDVQRLFERLDSYVEFVRNESTRRLRIGMVSGIHDIYTPGEFYRLQGSRGCIAKHSTLIVESCQRLREMLREGSLDIALLITDTSESDEFISRPLHEGQMYLMVHTDNPLAKQSSVRITDLRGQTFVSRGDAYDLHRMIMDRCREEGFAPTCVFQSAATFDLVCQVNSNLGVAYSVSPNITHYTVDHVVCLPFEEPFMRWYLIELVSRSRRIDASDDPYWDTTGRFPQPRSL